MKPAVATAPDGGQQQLEDEPEQPPPRRHADADRQSPLPPRKHRRARADPEQVRQAPQERAQQGERGPEEKEEERARPLAGPDLRFPSLLHLAQRNL